MARGDQVYRQWSILIELTKGRRSRRALSELFDVSLKTITRDIDTLSQFPIVEEREGIDVFYHCLPTHRPPHISLSASEVAAIVLGRRCLIDALEGSPFKEALESALDKVARLQTDDTFRRLHGLGRVYQTDFYNPDVRVDHQDALLEAALSRKRVWVRYFSAARQELGERVIEPFFLHVHPYGLHVIAYCTMREDFVNLNVNLIEALRVLDETFEPEARGFDRVQFLESGFDGHYEPPVMDVCLRIDAPTSRWARDRFFHPTQRVTEVADGVVEVRFRAGGGDAIVARVLSLGSDCEVVEPAYLRDRVRERARQIIERYTPESDGEA